MELIFLSVLALSLQVPTIRGSPVELESSRFIELPVGGTLELNCSSSSMYIVDFKEIGQSLSVEEKAAYRIEQAGNPRVRYSNDSCVHNDHPVAQNITCIKTLELDIVESLHGKSFQCRARTRDPIPETYYSEGSYLHVRQHITLTPTEMPSSSVKSSGMLTPAPTTIEPSPTSLRDITRTVVSPTSDVLCLCSGSTGTRHSSFLSLTTAALVLVVCFVL